MDLQSLRTSRRAFLLGTVLAMQSVLITAMTRTERARNFFRAFHPFNPLDDPGFSELIAAYTETPVPLAEGEPDAEGRRTFRFSLAQATPVFLSASAPSSRPIYVHPLVVRLQDGPRLLLPLLRSANPDRDITATIQLGLLEAGDHEFTLEQDPALTVPIPDSLVLRAARPDSDALLAKFLLQTPVIAVKHAGNPLDDIPLMAFAKIFRRGDQYKVTSFV
ncbi:MAG: hypothetical protein KC438_00770, partial [Thermomicrobiales bacterium]|nr:hypothetical protein [Thermomicrobiales bacterium]